METSAKPDLLGGTGYRAIRKIGQGSMGMVLEAEHVALRSPCCVKLLLAAADEQVGVSDRFRVEAQALAQLEHANIVRVQDLGITDEGRPYFVMERLHGVPLQDLLAQLGHLDIEEAITLFLGLLDGLAAAHAIGVVHRDIKPANLFVCDAKAGGERLLKILDFGISKLLPRSAGQPLVAPGPPTEEGVMLGTPRYVAPEQALGQKVDERVDIYSSALVLYRMVAGQGPYDRCRQLAELISAQVNTMPEPPSRLASQSIPKWLDEAILHALAKRPDDRFQTAHAFAQALRAGANTGRAAAMRTSTRTEMLPERALHPALKTSPMAASTPSPRGPAGTEVLSPEMHAALSNMQAIDDDPDDPDLAAFQPSPFGETTLASRVATQRPLARKAHPAAQSVQSVQSVQAPHSAPKRRLTSAPVLWSAAVLLVVTVLALVWVVQ